MRRPVYLSLASHISQTISSGLLAPGERLPTHRWLADRLDISVQTVSRAYEELIRNSEVVGEVGRGTFVRSAERAPAHPFIPERRDGELIDLSMLKPVSGRLQTERMKQALTRLQSDLPLRLLHSFRPNVVLRPHREIAVGWLARCGLQVVPDNIHITNGATPAMTMALMAAARPGQLMVTEEVGHHTLVALAGYLGIELKGLPVDEEGLVAETFEAACRENDVKLVFLVPTVANPTVAVMGLERRRAIVEFARRHDVAIVENEAWGPLVEQRPPPIAALAPERTLYFTSFTKCVVPALRVGYLVVPDAMNASVANRHLVTNWIATPIMSELASRWVADGTAAELVEWQRRELRARHAIARELLEGTAFRGHPESLHIWLPLPPPWEEDEFVAHARLRGVAVAPGSSFVTKPSARLSAVRICIGSPSVRELRKGLEIIARLIAGAAEPALLAI